MSTHSRISIQTAEFDVTSVIDELRGGNPAVGAVASFIGLVRDSNDGAKVSGMTLEHYSGMTEKALEAIVAEAHERWDLIGVTVIHRVGELRPGEAIVLVAVASGHRNDAFRACEFIMDFLKTRAPLWKKEQVPEGSRWVESRASDGHAARRWKG